MPRISKIVGIPGIFGFFVFLAKVVSIQHIILLSPGSPKTPWIKDGVAHFTSRVSAQVRFDHQVLPPSRASDPAKYRSDESDLLLRKLTQLEGDVWLLDEAGSGMTSREFASVLSRAKDQGRTLIFILGGAYGVDDRVHDRASHVLALSKMTFPHELCAIIFLEQLYRAVEIGKGSGYHH